MFIRVCHYYNLAVIQFFYVEIVTISNRESTPKGIYHGFNLIIGENFLNGNLLDIKDFSPDRQYCLKDSIAGCFSRATCRIRYFDYFLNHHWFIPF